MNVAVNPGEARVVGHGVYLAVLSGGGFWGDPLGVVDVYNGDVAGGQAVAEADWLLPAAQIEVHYFVVGLDVAQIEQGVVGVDSVTAVNLQHRP